MSEAENTENEEIRAEDEDELESDVADGGSYLKNLGVSVVSVARQILCSCSVMIFPVLHSTYSVWDSDYLETYTYENMINDTDPTECRQAIYVRWTTHTFIVSIVAYIISGIALYSIGRKYSVIIANLFHLVILLNSYRTGTEETIPYVSRLAQTFAKEFAYVPYSIYLAEITGPTARPFFLGLYFLIHGLTKVTVRGHRKSQMFLILAAITSLSLTSAPFIPETPFWQILKGSPEKSEETFTWLRAGNPDMVEFDQMIVRADDIMEKGANQLVPYLATRTFGLGVLFSSCITICSFKSYDMMMVLLNHFMTLVPTEKGISKKVLFDLGKLKIAADTDGAFYFQLIFLFLSFMVPRKIIFFLSYALGVLIVAIVGPKLGPMYLMMLFSFFINLVPYLGVVPLSMILPVEIYPAALREIGAVVTAVLIQARIATFTVFKTRSKENFVEKWLAPEVSYTFFIGSLFAIAFIMMFMPETRGMSIYQLDELTLKLPLRGHEETEAEGAVTEDEGED